MTVPEIMTTLRQDIVRVPKIMHEAPGLKVLGHTIHTLLFSTDVALIRNTDADGVIAVYPFTPHPAIIQAICQVADIPVFAGIGGGLTSGKRSADIGLLAEANGAIGMVVNAPTTLRTVQMIKKTVDSPLVLSVVAVNQEIDAYLEAGVALVNVSGGPHTPEIVARLRRQYPDLPIIATGGPTDDSIRATLAAGANVLTYTPPTNGELFRHKMDRYREQIANDSKSE
ncbi:hydrolase [Lacticaseibacillus yichunensis]|uniref:Hydrolase n=1 Tax=Lacticaseibacillus yichunensis TaxID=2486015 RepID=A0ABW4CPJ4_9LACO|nr:hydrolase [Lacticaseibacillus yichunensis]